MKKSFVLAFIVSNLCLFSSGSFAQTLVMGLATQFAMQAGTIGGTVQACGQSIVEYNSRVVDAVNAMASTPEARAQAMTAYQKALADAQDAEQRSHSVNCGQAIQSFNGLPIMQPDYKKTVIPQLAQIANPVASNTPNVPATTSTQSFVTNANPSAVTAMPPTTTAPQTTGTK